MSEINTFSDRDCGRISNVVRRVENKITVPVGKRPPPVPDPAAANPLAHWYWKPHSSTASGLYSNFGDLFGTEIVSRHGDFKSLGIDFVSDTEVTTGACSWMRFNVAGSYFLSWYVPLQSTAAVGIGGIDGIMLMGDFQLDLGRTTGLGLTSWGGGQRIRFAHPGLYTAVYFQTVLNITGTTTLKFNIDATGAGRPNGSTNYGYMDYSTTVYYGKTSWDNGRCVIRKFDTMPSSPAYYS